MSLSLEETSQIATIVGSIIAAFSLVYVAVQLRHSVKVADGQFLLELEKMAYTHDEVHLKLRPGGEWAASNAGPKSVEDWAKVEDYMGFFEHCELLMKNKSLDEISFREIFGYRVHNIVSNETIVEAKLKSEKVHWGLFLNLMNRMNINS